MSFLPKLKKSLILGVVVIFLGVSAPLSLTASAEYSWNDFEHDFNDFFSSGEGDTISFTDFEGQLAQLSPEGYDTALTSSTDAREFIIRIVNFALGFLGLIAVLIVIYGGVLYVTAAGEEEKTQKGKKAIGYATIGLLIVLGSFAFVNTVIKGGTGGTDTTGQIGSNSATYASKGGFNASAEQLRAYAVEIFNGFKFLAESTEEIKNIQNDANKQSLIPRALPSKSNILSFLTNTKSKLKNLKTRLQPFSSAEAAINDMIRDLETEIDKINVLDESVYIKQPGANDTNASVCKPEEENVVIGVDIGASDQEICKKNKFEFSYIKGLYEAWKPLFEKYKEKTLYDPLIKFLSEDYSQKLTSIIVSIDEIYQSYASIAAVKDGKAGIAFNSMNTQFGNGGLLGKVMAWSIDVDITTPGDYLMKGLSQLAILYKEIAEMQFVQVRLSANTTEGAAPLNVLFDTVGSVDPAGGSIDGNLITWDLGGSQTLTELMGAPTGTFDVDGDGFDCVFTVPQDGDPEDYIGTTAKRCTYTMPGTYRAAVKINSREPNKYAPGIAIITIKVKAPTTKIKLKVKPPGDKEIIVMDYVGDLLVSDRKTVPVTQKSAENIRFDAASTNAAFYKWDFGDGTVTDFKTSGVEDHTYKEAGKYKVTLEVMNEVGVIDRKIFTVEVSSIAARIQPQPESIAFVNNQVTFDASSSKSDLGKIINYEWVIDYVDDKNMDAVVKAELNKIYRTPDFKESGGNLKALTHTFKFPGKYNIHLSIKDNSSSQLTAEADIQNYQVKSKPPVAILNFEIPKKNKPSTVYFNGSKSYDPDGIPNVDYLWTITPADGYKTPLPAGHNLESAQPIVTFNKKGDYQVKLKVSDKLAPDEFHEIEKTLKIDNILSLDWDAAQKSTANLNDKAEALAKFKFSSENALTYEIDYGDGETDSDDVASPGPTTEVEHIYRQSGKYNVRLKVYDADDNENAIERRFFVGGGEKPIGKIKLFINGEEYLDLSKPVKVSKKDNLEFDAGDSKNMDGTSKDLTYSWDFGNNKNSSKKKATNIYKELSPKDPGYYKVKLLVADKDDPSKKDEDEIQIDVINKAPIFSSIEAVPQAFDASLVTPVQVNVKGFGAEDEDGEIVKYKWWYFDVDDPDEPLGLQITDGPIAQLTIGTRGKEGKKITYGFGLEVTDSDGLKFSNQEAIDDDNFNKLTVTNGANAAPVAKFNATPTSVFVGDKVTFTSASTDPDGKIETYYWDVEGDGFYNNDPTEEPSFEHVYTSKNKEGYSVRLKVVDDKGGETTSTEAIKIYVDSLAKPPTAAFKHEVIQGSEGMKIRFINNSAADDLAGSKIISYKWDFDTDTLNEGSDTDGDGKKDNDVDSQAKDPERLYIEHGTYKVKLIVTDDQGNSDEAVNAIVIPLANPPVAAFTYEVKEDTVVFKNNSAGDTKAGTILKEFIWDFDTASNLQKVDSDGDGNKDNDKDSSEKDPTHKYSAPGIYRVKLTVIDNQGNFDDVVNEVNFALPTSNNLDNLTGNQNGNNGNGTGTTTTPQTLKAVIIPNPASSADGIVYLPGESGSIQFDFTKSLGPITYYIIDKNINFDTNGNGNKADDEDFKTSLPGTWKTNFEKIWGKIIVKLIVRDLYGNENSTNLEVKFK